MSPRIRLLGLWGPVVAYMAMLFFISSLSSLPSPPGAITDKHEHFFFYGMFSLLTVRALAGGEWRRIGLAVVIGATVICGLYGVSDEIHQRFVPGRDYEVLDMVADTIGAATAACLLWAWSILRRRSDTHHVL